MGILSPSPPIRGRLHSVKCFSLRVLRFIFNVLANIGGTLAMPLIRLPALEFTVLMLLVALGILSLV